MIHLLNHFFFDKELNNFDILFQDFLNFENFLILINFALMIEIYHLNLLKFKNFIYFYIVYHIL